MQECHLFSVVFLMMICIVVPQYDTQFIPRTHGSPRLNEEENSNHHHNHHHEHRHNSEDSRIYPIITQTQTSRSHSHSMNSNHHFTTVNPHQNTRPRPLGMVLAPKSTVKNDTKRKVQELDLSNHSWQNLNTDPVIRSAEGAREDINISVIRDIFFRNITDHKSTGYDSRMVYPGEAETAPFETKIKSRNCTFGLCEEVDNYPVERVEHLVSRSLELKRYFEHMEVPTQIDFNTRFGEDGDSLCRTMTHTVFPKSARNTQDVELILVNVGEYKQGVVFETCASEGGACTFSETFPIGYSATCKQKFSVRRLMAVAKEAESPVFDNFPLPSCCVCTIKKKGF